MDRRNFLKLTPLASLCALLRLPPQPRATLSVPAFQNDPPTFHWADAIQGVSIGDSALLDLSSVTGNAALVYGFLYFIADGTGVQKVEIRPTGLPGALGFTEVANELRAAEVALPLMVRCANDGRFEMRLTRNGLTAFEWAYCPVAWW